MSITLLPDFLTEAEARELLARMPERPPAPLFDRIADAVEGLGMGYCARGARSRQSVRIECQQHGHPWHFDGCAGTPWEPAEALQAARSYKLKPGGHDWARLSFSLLLSDPATFTGGELELLTEAGEVVRVSPKLHHRTLVVWHSGLVGPGVFTPALHRVHPHQAVPGSELLGWSHNSEGATVRQFGGARYVLVGFLA